MTQSLETIFGELGIAQYLDGFIEQGFDSWDTIVDITESDLDTLGVKLGHRRKLQRRIANSLGITPGMSLTSPVAKVSDDAKAEGQRGEVMAKIETRNGGQTVTTAPPAVPAAAAEPPTATTSSTTTVATKRKYRRHPKPDENAPERPPSAYVLFSNKMREDLKGRNLTFTEIAKLVGENWQSLSVAGREKFEAQAQAAKDKYNAELAKYKMTSAYRKYNEYLRDFKAKHVHDKNVSKRIKVTDSGSGSRTSNGCSSATPTWSSGSGSASEENASTELAPSRQQRICSVASMPESQYSASSTARALLDEACSPPPTASNFTEARSRAPSPFVPSPRDFPPVLTRRSSKWVEDQRSGRRHLPPLADVFDGRSRVNGGGPSPSGEVVGFSFSRAAFPENPASVPGLTSDGHPPSLRTEKSSTGSLSSGSSGTLSRIPADHNSLSIHALLTPKANDNLPVPSTAYRPPIPALAELPPRKASLPPFTHTKASPPLMKGMPQHSNYNAAMGLRPLTHRKSDFSSRHQLPLSPSTTLYFPSRTAAVRKLGQDADYDGMSALLRAGEIVDRRAV